MSTCPRKAQSPHRPPSIAQDAPRRPWARGGAVCAGLRPPPLRRGRAGSAATEGGFRGGKNPARNRPSPARHVPLPAKGGGLGGAAGGPEHAAVVLPKGARRIHVPPFCKARSGPLSERRRTEAGARPGQQPSPRCWPLGAGAGPGRLPPPVSWAQAECGAGSASGSASPIPG